MKRKKIYLVFNVDYFAKSHFENYVKSLIDSGFDVTMFMNCDSNVSFNNGDLHIIHIPFHRSSLSLVNLMIVVFSLYRHFFKFNFDAIVVEFFTAKPLLASFLISPLKLLNYKFINYVTGLGYISSSKSLPLRVVRKIIYPFVFKTVSNALIVENSGDFAYVYKYNQNVFRLNGVGCVVPKSIPIQLMDRDIDFIFVARLLKDKGIIEFCDFIKKINSKEQFNVIILGEIDPSNPMSLTFEELEVLKRTTPATFLGHRSDVGMFLKRSKCYVLPSYREGFPKSIIEAMSHGCVVLTSNVVGCRDAVQHYKTGFIFEPYSAQSIFDCSSRISELDLKAISIQAHDFARKNFQQEHISAMHVQIIYKVYNSG